MSIQQISVFMENKAGQLAEVTGILAQNGIDLRALHIAETADYGVLRITATRPQDAVSILLEHGFILSMTEVLAVPVPDEPGGLAKVLDILAQAEIDIEYMYSMISRDDRMAYMIFRVGDIKNLEGILADHGIPTATDQQLGL